MSPPDKRLNPVEVANFVAKEISPEKLEADLDKICKRLDEYKEVLNGTYLKKKKEQDIIALYDDEDFNFYSHLRT